MAEANTTKLEIEVAVLTKTVEGLTKSLDKQTKFFEDTIKEMKETYVTKDQFSPIQKVVYGLVSTILVTVIAGIMALIVNK